MIIATSRYSQYGRSLITIPIITSGQYAIAIMASTGVGFTAASAPTAYLNQCGRVLETQAPCRPLTVLPDDAGGLLGDCRVCALRAAMHGQNSQDPALSGIRRAASSTAAAQPRCCQAGGGPTGTRMPAHRSRAPHEPLQKTTIRVSGTCGCPAGWAPACSPPPGFGMRHPS